LWLDGGAKYVHRLVATLFLALDETSGDLVLHMCDRPSCCNPDHLRVGSHEENMADAAAKGRMGKKLKPRDVSEIRRLRAEGHTQQDLAERFGVSRMTIRQIERRETWRHLPDEAQDASTRSDSTLDSLAESA
jgi:DNA-binding XRE family transcriptional regulator